MAGTTVGTNLGYTFGPFTESIVPVIPKPPPASVATIASQQLTADLDYFQNKTTPITSPHITQIVSEYSKHHPLGFLATQGPIGASMTTEAVRQDVFAMLQVMNAEWGHSPAIEADITQLRTQPTDALLAAIPTLIRGMYRTMTVQTIAQMQQMDSEIQQGLWGSSTRSDSMMSGQFHRATDELNQVLVLIDQGNIDDALLQYSATMNNAGAQIRCFQGAHAESEREKFAAHVGITVIAGLLAAYTGGLSLTVMAGGTEALAAGTGAGLGAYATSTAISSATFVISDRMLQKQIFGIPMLRKDNVLENTKDWGTDILTTAALFGWMNGVGIAAKSLPAFSGELAPTLNAFKNFGAEYAGLTTFNVATSDTPQHVFTKDFHQKNLAFLMGVKIGNAGVASTFKAGRLLWDARPNPEIPLLQRIPLGGIVLTNMNLSLVSSKAVSIALLCGYISLLGKVPHDGMTSAADAWVRTNTLALQAAIPFFLGADAVMSRIPATRAAYRAILDRTEIAPRSLAALESITGSLTALQLKAWKHDVVAKLEKAAEWGQEHVSPVVNKTLNRLPLGLGTSVREAFTYYADGIQIFFRAVPIYAEEFALHGIIGCNRLAGERNPEISPAVDAAKNALKLNPVELTLRTHLGRLAFDPVVKVVSAPFDRFARFVGEVVPNRRGAFGGFLIDIGANTALDIAGTMIFNETATLSELMLPGLLISALVGFANTRISQHVDFTASQGLINRAKLGIMKSAAFRGVWKSPATNYEIDMVVQGVYGLYAMWQAHQWTQPQSPIPKEILARIETAKNRGNLSVAVLDSGYGGLGMFANIQNRLEHGPFTSFTNAFMNVQTAPGKGLNNMPTLEAKAAYLDQQIRQVVGETAPDLVILACHTLGLIYPHTTYAKQAAEKNLTPVLDINHVSVEMMVRGMRDAPNAKMVMMATPTVAESGYFQSQLKGRKIDTQRLVSAPTNYLLESSQRDPSGVTTSTLVNQKVDQVLQHVGDLSTPVLVALNCSQYALISGVIQNAFAARGVNATLINPQVELMNELFGQTALTGHAHSSQVHVYTQVPVPSAMSELFKQVSTTAADAMRHWQQPPALLMPAEASFHF